MTADTKKQSGLRLTAVCMFIGVPLLLIALTALNVVQFDDDQFAVAEKQTQLAALTRRLNTNSSAIKPRDLSTIYVNGATRSLASAALQQYIVDAIANTSGRLIEIAVIDAEATDDEEGHTLRLKTTLDTDNQSLLQLLYKLESGLPLLYVDTLSVRRLPSADGDTFEKLRIELGMRGTWRQGEK